MEQSRSHGKITSDLREVSEVSSSRANCFKEFAVQDYSLPLTLDSGQAFRWTCRDGKWVGVVEGRWVRLAVSAGAILAETAQPVSDWFWLEHYLQMVFEPGPVGNGFGRFGQNGTPSRG